MSSILWMKLSVIWRWLRNRATPRSSRGHPGLAAASRQPLPLKEEMEVLQKNPSSQGRDESCWMERTMEADLHLNLMFLFTRRRIDSLWLCQRPNETSCLDWFISCSVWDAALRLLIWIYFLFFPLFLSWQENCFTDMIFSDYSARRIISCCLSFLSWII